LDSTGIMSWSTPISIEQILKLINSPKMKIPIHLTLVLLVFFLSSTAGFTQSFLTDSVSGCHYVLPWTCSECTVSWTGKCQDNLPEGEGILTVHYENNEIMRYEGEMKNGNFNGYGSYRDGMNQIEGNFKNGTIIQDQHPSVKDLSFNKTVEWEEKKTITKEINNLYFTFPSEGYAFKNRNSLIEEALDAIESNCALINETNYDEFTKIWFLKSKQEMQFHTSLFASGASNLWTRSVYVVINLEDESTEDAVIIKPPIKHELMHMVSMTKWGPPQQNVTWLNEGLATYAENNCNEFTVEQIYRYFLEKDMLISMDLLSTNFYAHEEMIAYHQSAYIVQYLITNYGIDKFKRLWQNGISIFEDIYSVSTAQMIEEINKKLIEQSPTVPNIDWDTFKEGCK